jgi:hypothetical protein
MTEVRQEAYTPEEGDGIAPEVSEEDPLTQDQIDAASADKFDKAQEIEEPDNIVNDEVKERPDHIPEKFWKDDKVDVEGLLKGYTELEKKLSTPPEDPPADGDSPAAEDNASQEDTPPAEGKFDFQAATEEFTKNGELSEATLKKLEDAGIPKEAVDMFAEGMEHYAGKQITELQNMVGGEEAYGKMIEWAAANLTQAEQDAFDKALVSGHEQAKFAIQGLHAKHQSSVGTEGNLLTPDNAQKVTGGYESLQQMKADMKDPRYAQDPAFRAEVQKKLENASFEW